MILRWLTCITLLCACAAPQPIAEAPIEFEIDLGRVAHTMDGGIGASWHAIAGPLPVVQGKTHAGSAWGGNPHPDDETRWAQLETHADWLGLSWMRVELSTRMFEPERRTFTWDSEEMRALYRILDWCESRGVDVLLQLMWGNVAWNTFPEWQNRPVLAIHSGPASLEDFAFGLARLVEHLQRERGYTRLRWLSIANEPGYGWSWFVRPDEDGREPMPIRPALAAVRAEMDARRLDLPLTAPGWTGLPPLDESRLDFDGSIGAYDLHFYLENPAFRTRDLPFVEAEERLRDWTRFAHSRDKPFFLSEIGSMAFGWGNSDPAPGGFDAALKTAEAIIRGLNVGVDGFSRWSFVNRGDLDGQWQLVDTWDPEEDRLREDFEPHLDSYPVFGLMSRYSALHSDVLEIRVSEPIGEERRVHMAALRSPEGALTLLVVNGGEDEQEVGVSFRGLTGTKRLFRYQISRQHEGMRGLRFEPEVLVSFGRRTPGRVEPLPAHSLTVLTTYSFGHDQPGVIAERR